ncbi:MAG: spondin domain-containing protein [Pseudomonadota bacterium]
MKHMITATLLSVSILIADSALARELNVRITNLANALYFTPLLVAAHGRGMHLFQVGQKASFNLQLMAEGGDISGLINDVEAKGGVLVADPAAGVLAPGESATAKFKFDEGKVTYLSIVAMLLPTNDGFVGLDAVKIPNSKGRYVFHLNGYDAATEANDEIINGGGVPGVPGIPADPGGNGGVKAKGAAGPDHNTKVHVHRGILGDTQLKGGISDLDSRIHRWLNPVAQLVVTVD